MRTTLSVRLPEDMASQLDHIAGETERSRSFHIQKAIETYLEEYADLQIALDRLHNPADKLVSGKEMRKRLGL